MNVRLFSIIVAVMALIFTAFFFVSVVPALLADFDVLAAFAAGFVNPYSSGYSADVIVCWFILATWVWFEKAEYRVRNGWVCLIVGIVPGVAVGFAAYLIMRQSQLSVTSR